MDAFVHRDKGTRDPVPASLLAFRHQSTAASCLNCYIPLIPIDVAYSKRFTLIITGLQPINRRQSTMKSLKPRLRLPRTFKSLELNSEDSRWANADILPCPEDHRTFTNRAFLGYCMLATLPSDETLTTDCDQQDG
jgi:hypothetical protein